MAFIMQIRREKAFENFVADNAIIEGAFRDGAVQYETQWQPEEGALDALYRITKGPKKGRGVIVNKCGGTNPADASLWKTFKKGFKEGDSPKKRKGGFEEEGSSKRVKQ